MFIGNDIEILCLGVRGEQVRLGIRAPKDVPVYRAEVYERIKAEQAAPHTNVQDGTPKS